MIYIQKVLWSIKYEVSIARTEVAIRYTEARGVSFSHVMKSVLLATLLQMSGDVTYYS